MPTLAGTPLRIRAHTTTGGISPRPLRIRAHILRGGVPRAQWVQLPTAVRAPVAYGPKVTQPGTVIPDLAAKVFHRSDPDTLVATLDQSFAKTFLDELSEPGFGSVSLENSDPDLALMHDGDLIRFEVKGSAAWTMLANEVYAVTIAGNEEVGEVTTISGPGHLAVMAEALVYPARGVGVLPVEEDRVFNWAAYDFDDTKWGAATSIALASAVPPENEGWWDVILTDWPDPAAEWIWASGSTASHALPGVCYFRHWFTLAAPARLTFLATIDNGGDLYVDGQLIFSGMNDLTRVWTSTLDMSAGDHLIAVKGENPDGPAVTIDPGGVLVTVWETAGDGSLTNLVTHSDSGWMMVEYPANAPGMTPGEVIRRVVVEAQARGALTGVTLHFTDEVDSDGVAWPRVADIATKVGTDCLQLLRELSGTYIDVWMAPAGLDLWAWVKDGRGELRDVSIHGPTDPDDPGSGNIGDGGLTHRKVI